MKRWKSAIVVALGMLVVIEPASAGARDPGLWTYSDRMIFQVDPSSSLAALMKKAGGLDLPDKTNTFEYCITPERANIPIEKIGTDSSVLKENSCKASNRQQTGTHLSFDLECRNSRSHLEINYEDKRHVLETVKSDPRTGMTSTVVRKETWLKADCGSSGTDEK